MNFKPARIVVLLTLVFQTLPATAEEYQFQRDPGISIEILTQESFQTQYGDNREIPTLENEIIALARKLYPSLAEVAAMPDEDPGSEAYPETFEIDDQYEHETGLLFAALQNPAVDDFVRAEVDNIIAEATPALPQTFTKGHFKIMYTTNDADPKHNVTLRQVKSLAGFINDYWNQFKNGGFATPKHYVSGGKKLIDVKIYYLGAGLRGSTSSSWDYIRYSSKLAVRNACKRKTTGAHELFHRVQYAYDYISGSANHKWAVEATAAWSQKYTNKAIRDYMARMTTGLNTPDTDLTGSRSYDAAHLWVYLEQRAGTSAIRDFWKKYKANGKNLDNALNFVTNSKLGINREQFIQDWIKANLLKDLTSPGAKYDYSEDEVSVTKCGINYGPLPEVPRQTFAIKQSTVLEGDITVQPYGADYFEFNLDPAMRRLTVKADPSDADAAAEAAESFSWHLVLAKNNKWKTISNSTSNKKKWVKDFSPGQYEKAYFIGAGRAQGGTYKLTVGTPCSVKDITGTWDGFGGGPATLVQTDTKVSGDYDTGDGIWPMRGTNDGVNVKLVSKKSPLPAERCNFRFNGTFTGGQCDVIGGTWVQLEGGICNNSGSLSITKRADADGSSVDPTSQEANGAVSPTFPTGTGH